MQAFSIIDVPKYQQKKLLDTVQWVSCDYMRFNIRDRKLLDWLLIASVQADNTTNTNVAYDRSIAYLRIKSPRGVAHQIIAWFEEVWPVPFAYIEIYWHGQGLKWSVARIDFYGAFFHFFDDLPSRYQQMYKHLLELSKWANKKVWVTRTDIAIDFYGYPFPQKWHLWINPAKNSEREIESYKHQWLWNSFGYLAEKNSWYWVRLYNKTVQVKKKGKESWYWWAEKIPEDWTRLEFEFYNPYCSKSVDELKDLCIARILGKKVELGMTARPTYTFNVENAYKYFERYAKNHWITVEQLLEELRKYHDYLEKTKEYYWLVDE